jgi:hypothetical protein
VWRRELPIPARVGCFAWARLPWPAGDNVVTTDEAEAYHPIRSGRNFDLAYDIVAAGFDAVRLPVSWWDRVEVLRVGLPARLSVATVQDAAEVDPAAPDARHAGTCLTDST